MTALVSTGTFNHAIDSYLLDQRAYGRINSPKSEAAYRRALEVHSDDVDNRPPNETSRDDVKRTLRRWTNPNTQRQKHAILASFYAWAMEEGIRIDNPAQQVRRARARQPSVYRPTREEVVRLLDVSMSDRRKRWVIHLGVLAGLRRQELCGLQGRHFARAGAVWVSEDIAKGRKERWVPVLPELRPVVDEICATVTRDHFVIPTRRAALQESRGGVLDNARMVEIPDAPMSTAGLYKLVKAIGEEARLGHEIGPHTLRHAFGDHVARHAGLRAAQALMGHASVATTESSYTGRVSLDELAASVDGFRFRVPPAGEPDVEGGNTGGTL